MTELIVQLTWFPLWSQPDCSVYPHYLSQLDEDVVVDPADLGKVVFGRSRLTAKGNRTDWYRMRNLYGIETKGDDTVSVRGIHILERVPDSPKLYRLSVPARRLRSAYLNGGTWKAELASMLLRFHPRLRAVLLPMARENWYIRSNQQAGGVFSVPARETVLCDPEQGDQYYFLNDPTERADAADDAAWTADINRLLLRDPAGAIGPWILAIAEEQGVNIDRQLRVASTHGGAPSTKDIDKVLRYALQVFCELGLFRYLARTGGWHLDVEAATQVLGVELAEDLAKGAVQDLREPASWVLHTVYQAAIDRDGLASMAAMTRSLAERQRLPEGVAYRELTRMLITGLSEGAVAITDHQPGMPADGPGFRGRLDYRLLELRFPVTN